MAPVLGRTEPRSSCCEIAELGVNEAQVPGRRGEALGAAGPLGPRGRVPEQSGGVAEARLVPSQEAKRVVGLEQILREVESDLQRQRLFAEPAGGGVITVPPCHESQPREEPGFGRGVACGARAVQPAEPERPRAVVLAPVVDALADGEQACERRSSYARRNSAAGSRAG